MRASAGTSHDNRRLRLLAVAIVLTALWFGGVPSLIAATAADAYPELLRDGSLGSARTFQIPDRVDHARLLAEDAAREDAGVVGPLRIATELHTRISFDSAGGWALLDGGWELWRVEIVSAGALSLSLYAKRVSLPPNSSMWLHDTTGRQLRGPFTAANVDHTGGLATPIIIGDNVVVEILLPPGTRSAAAFEVAQVYHGYRPLGAHGAGKIRGSCNINVVCEEGDLWRDQIRSVGLISTGQWVCSGNLLNNTAENQRPLFITAGHCDITSSNANRVTVYWNFDAPTCDEWVQGDFDDLDQYQTGATHLATWGTVSPSNAANGSDFTLLELNATPDPSFNVFYAGWDVSNRVPDDVVVVHHPDGDYKSISFEYDALSNTNYLGPDYFGGYGPDNWLRVADWDLGTTEGGSSGSCIFDADTGRCVGTLSGGFAACGNDDPDWFGWLYPGWEGNGSSSGRLRDYLDPTNSGATSIDGLDPNGGSTDFDNVWLVPAAASTPGYGSANWKSQITVVNHTVATRQASLYFVAAGAQWPGTLLDGPYTVAPHATVYLDDPLLPENPISGLVFVTMDQPGPLVSSRTFSLDSSGETYGQGIPGIELAAVDTPSELIIPLVHSIPGRFHANLGLVQTGTGSYSVEVTIYSRIGTPLGQKTYSQSSAFRQINNVFADMGQGNQSVTGAWLRVRLTGGTPSFWTAYVSLVDDLSYDPTFIAGVAP